MCGIVGLISKNPNGFFREDIKRFNQALVIDGVLRGMDSTGVFQVSRSGDVRLMKNATNAMLFMEDIEYDKWCTEAVTSGRVLIGHNRAATKGDVIPQNAHPFVKDNIILVHNGTLFGHKSMADTAVDSEAVAHRLAEEPDVHKVISEIDGAFTFVWWDMNKERLFLVRNHQRPMSLTETKDYYFLSSEPTTPGLILARVNEPVLSVKDVKAGSLVSFGLDGKDPTEEDIKLKSYTTYYGNYNSRSYTTTTQTSNDTKESSESESTTTEITVFDMPQKHYTIGDKVLVRVIKVFPAMTANAPDKWAGVVIQPGKPIIDAQGSFIGKLTEDERKKIYSGLTTGFVAAFAYSNCGPSITIDKVVLDLSVKTYNGQEFSMHEVDHICENEVCTYCTALLDPRLMEVTSITRISTGTDTRYRTTCPDCLSSKIKTESVKEAFDDLYTALQANIELSESLGLGDDNLRVANSSNLTH